jgi:predicted transcriptional regulator
MDENYLDIEDKFRQIRDLLALNWDNLTEEEEKEVNMSQISMHFFDDRNEVKRMYYEVNNIIKILQQATEF